MCFGNGIWKNRLKFWKVRKEEKMKKLRKLYEKLSARLLSVLSDEKGQTLVEYGLLVTLIAVVLVLMLKGTGLEVNNLWSRINSGISR
jgi:Flp pilus assembly pilin Flp